MRTVGVDLSAEPPGTAVATIEWGRRNATVDALVVGCTDEVVIDAARRADKVGIDCPFGWPTSFTAFLKAHQEGTVPAPQVPAIDWRRSLANRETDLFVRRQFGIRPLSVAADRIAYPAMRCAALLGRLAEIGSVDRAGSGLVAEVYPAASLKRWDLPYRRYKSRDGAVVREEIIEALRRTMPWLDLGRFEGACHAVDHALDAVVAALTARAVCLGLTAAPGAQQAGAAATEGWIHVPTAPPAALDPSATSVGRRTAEAPPRVG